MAKGWHPCSGPKTNIKKYSASKTLSSTGSPKLETTHERHHQALNISQHLHPPNKANRKIYISSYHLPNFEICKHHIEPYHIKHWHQEAAKHSEKLRISTGCTRDTNT